MRNPRSLAVIAFGALLGLVPLLWAARTQDPKAGQPKPAASKPAAHASETTATSTNVTGSTVWPAGDIKWVPMPGLEGAQQAPLWGDPTKEAHGILYKWAAGTKTPLHTHTFGDRCVVVSGTMTLAVDGAAPKTLPPGSYFSLAAGLKHVTACADGAPCVFFVEREGLFDVNVVDAAGKK